MEHFYDGQIRKYLTQLVRMFSNFSYKDGKGNLVQVPVVYGDMTRQVASIIRENSENKIPSAPRMAVYITGLEMDRDRTSDSSFVSKVHVRERAISEDGTEYLNTQGKNYTVERLMPTPYRLSINVDLWSTNTEQKLQILEPILTLFNPSLEIQTTDNYIDWTSLSVVNLEGITFSSRAIPVGVDSEIDVAQLQFSTPIYLSPPAKVKRLGVVTNIITSIFEGDGYIDFESRLEGTNLFSIGGMTQESVESRTRGNLDSDNLTVDNGEFPNTGDGNMDIDSQYTRYNKAIVKNPTQYRIYVMDDIAKIIDKGQIGEKSWKEIINILPGQYQPGLSIINLRRPKLPYFITGRFTINPLNETELLINWDQDMLPSNSIITSSARQPSQYSSIDYIVDPLRFNPEDYKAVGVRLLLLGAIGNSNNADGADAWKNADNSDFVADANDIVEWDGSKWTVIWAASENVDPAEYTYITNLKTSIQYFWNGEEWLLSYQGEYAKGDWVIDLNG